MRFAAEHFNLSEQEITAIDQDFIKGILRDLAEPTSWPFLSSSRPGIPKKTLQDCELQMANAGSVSSTFVVHPRSFGRHLYVLHLYSGRRRQGDFQFFLEKLSRPGAILHTILVDIVLDKTWGDAMRRKTRSGGSELLRQVSWQGLLARLGRLPGIKFSQAAMALEC